MEDLQPWAYGCKVGRGLVVEIRPNGQKYFIVRAFQDGKEKRKHVGIYPEMSLREARIKAVEARRDIFAAPAEVKCKTTFGEVAQEWLKKRMGDKNAKHVEKTKLRLNKYILPEFKDVPIQEITSGMVLKLCRKIEARGTVETATRVKGIIGQVFRYAIATDRADYDPTAALKGALQTRRVKHMAAITKPSEIAVLMKNINNYPRFIVRCALKFSALVFCRPGEIRQAEWRIYSHGHMAVRLERD